MRYHFSSGVWKKAFTVLSLFFFLLQVSAKETDIRPLYFYVPLTQAHQLKSAPLKKFIKLFIKQYGRTDFICQSSDIRNKTVCYPEFSQETWPNPDSLLSEVLASAGLQFENIQGLYFIKLADGTFKKNTFQPPAQKKGIRAKEISIIN